MNWVECSDRMPDVNKNLDRDYEDVTVIACNNGHAEPMMPEQPEG